MIEYFKLAQPFPAEDVEWLIAATGKTEKGDMIGLAVPYVRKDAIIDRLDNTVGVENWQDEYQCIPVSTYHEKEKTAVPDICFTCKISIYSDLHGQFISRCDGAGSSDIEPLKGGYTAAFKRAASKWGVGRYLGEIGGRWVFIEKKGNSYKIIDTQLSELTRYYEESLQAIQYEKEHKQQEQRPSAPAPGCYEVRGSQVLKQGNGYLTKVLLLDSNGGELTGFIPGQASCRTGQIIRANVVQKKTRSGGSYNSVTLLPEAA